MRSLALIPARGGSKRVPRKNLADVGGRSLLVRAIESAAPCSYRVVSTDDAEIVRAMAGIMSEGRCDVHPRKPEHGTDTAQLEDVIADVLAQHGGDSDAIVLLQPTSPFRTAAHVAEALRILRETGCDSVVSVTRLHSLHPVFHGLLWEDASGRYAPLATNLGRPPSDALRPLVYENGAVYAFTRKHWNATRSRMGGDCRALVMHWSEAVDVDTPEDLEACRRLA